MYRKKIRARGRHSPVPTTKSKQDRKLYIMNTTNHPIMPELTAHGYRHFEAKENKQAILSQCPSGDGRTMPP